MGGSGILPNYSSLFNNANTTEDEAFEYLTEEQRTQQKELKLAAQQVCKLSKQDILNESLLEAIYRLEESLKYL